MKKTHKVIALLTSVLLLSQVSAMAKPYENYPFVYEDFEDKTVGGFESNLSAGISVSNDGYGGSNASLKVTVKGDRQSARVMLPDMQLNKKYKISCYIKASKTLTVNPKFVMFLREKTAEEILPLDPSDQVYSDLGELPVTVAANKWIKLESTYTFTGVANKYKVGNISVDGSGGKIEVRFGSGNLTDLKSSEEEPFIYEIDDFSVEPELTESTVEDVEPNDKGVLIKDGSFEGERPGKHWVADGVTVTVTEGGANETEQSVKVSGTGVFKQQIPLTYSHAYFFNGYIKGTGGSVGKKASLVIDRGTAGKETYELKTLTDQWQSFSLDYYKPASSGSSDNPYMYISVEDSADYYLDEISLKPGKGVIYNGEFAAGWEKYWESDKENLASVSADIPADEAFVPKQAIKITQQKSGTEKIYQNVYMLPNTEYKLSFWAKSGVVKDKNDEDQTLAGKTIYPIFEYLSGEKTVKYDYLKEKNINKPTFESDGWKKYEITFTTPESMPNLVKFYLLTGVSLQARAYYLGDIKLEKTSESGEAAEEGQGTDVKYQTPEIRNPILKGEVVENKEIRINAEYLGPEPQTGLIQLFKQAEDGGWASIKTAEFNGNPLNYTFKTSDIGQEIKYRIIPIGEKDTVGGIREIIYEGKVKPELEIIKGFETGLTGLVKASAEVVNKKPDAENVTCMLTLYNGENTCVGESYCAKEVASNATETFNVEVTNPGTAVKAKLFVWEGTSNINTSMISLSKAIEIKE